MEHDFRRNATFFILWEFLWGMGMPFAMVGTLVNGVLADARGPYDSAFLLGAATAAIASLGFLLLMREPRTGRLYIVKVTPR